MEIGQDAKTTLSNTQLRIAISTYCAEQPKVDEITLRMCLSHLLERYPALEIDTLKPVIKKILNDTVSVLLEEEKREEQENEQQRWEIPRARGLHAYAITEHFGRDSFCMI